MEFEGIVIRQTPFRDHDAMVTVLCNDKLRSFLVRGALKYDSKLGPAANMYTRSRFQLMKGKEGYALRNGEILDSFEKIKTNIDCLAVEDFLGELTNKLIQSDDAGEIYPSLLKSLELLNNGFSPFTVALIYFAKVLQVAGFGLNVDSCQICGKKDSIIAISYHDGGFICRDCLSPLKHAKSDPNKLKIIRYIFKVDLANYSKVEFDKKICLSLINELAKFLNDVAQLNLKSIELLKKI